MDNLNTNVDDYSNNELFDLAELNPQSDKNQIENHFTKIIQGYMGNNDYKMAQFFHDAKEKILNNLDNIDWNEPDGDEPYIRCDGWLHGQLEYEKSELEDDLKAVIKNDKVKEVQGQIALDLVVDYCKELGL